MTAADLFDLSGQTAVVTGGNSGLGLGFATGLAKCGSDVWIWGRRDDQNAEAVEQLSVHGTKARALAVDVADEQQVADAMAEVVATSGRVDTVVSNAGMAGMAPFHEMSTATYEQLLAVNQHGGFFTLREAVKHMKARADAGDPGGSIIICGSLSIKLGVPSMAHYGAAKGALLAMMASIAVEYGRDGIRCNMVAPGAIVTGFFGGATEDMIPLTEVLQRRNPIPRWGYPADVEGIAAYLASPAAGYHTGDVIVIDGGQSRLTLA